MRQELQKHGSPDIVMALVGNKADLQEKREVLVQVSNSLEIHQLFLLLSQIRSYFLTRQKLIIFCFLKDGVDYAERNGMFFIETSAKTADNINQLFEVYS